MDEPQVYDAQLTDFTPDPHNANRGTERGVYLVEESLQRNGAARSIVVSRDGVVLAGNKTLQAAIDSGILKARVVEVDGHELVVVKRTDVDSGTPRAIDIALSDNRASEVGLDWDPEALDWAQAQGADLGVWWTAEELDDLTNHWLQSQPPSLDELAEEYGEPEERAFWPIIRAQVSPETFDLWRSLLDAAPGEDEAAKVARVLGTVDAALLSAELS